MRSGLLLVPLGVLVVAAVACQSERPRVPTDMRGKVTTVELATFEIRNDQVDRFEHCPPPGEIGQDWVPAIPEWHPPAASASAAVPESAVDAPGASGDADAGAPDQPEALQPASAATLTDEAANQTRATFRTCFHRGLMMDPTQDGHVAVVLRVDRAGHVVAVESWGACDLAPDALVCMRGQAAHVHLHPPLGGFATITIPAVFTKGAERRRAPNDAYAAAAYVAVEAMRPRLHNCEQTAHRSGSSVFASATLSIDIDSAGHGVHVAVDQWKGGQEILACAAEVLRDAPFKPPPAGRGRVVVPIVFNPRPGTR
ncbi:MAG TPA: hypothetical protein VIF15_09650 [Polyangiaceae bacterium]